MHKTLRIKHITFNNLKIEGLTHKIENHYQEHSLLILCFINIIN